MLYWIIGITQESAMCPFTSCFKVLSSYNYGLYENLEMDPRIENILLEHGVMMDLNRMPWQWPEILEDVRGTTQYLQLTTGDWVLGVFHNTMNE